MDVFLILLLFFQQVHCLSFTLNATSERGWLAWAWGADSTVSVVDRSPIISFASRPAAFGEEISSPILGYVIPLSSFTVPCANQSSSVTEPLPNTGCPKLCISGPNEPEPSETWIALVQRGKCEFVSKVREAQRLGARAVIVGGDNPEVSGFPDTLVNMYSPEDSSDVKIPATFIKYSDYVELSALITASNTSHAGLRTLSLLITAEYSAWEWPIVTFIIILLLPSILTFLTLLIHRIRAARAAQRERAPEDIVHRLPWRVWTGNGWEKHEGTTPTEAAPPVDLASVDLELGLGPQAKVGTTTAEAEEVPSTSKPAEPESGCQPWFETQMECAICLCEFEKGDKVRVLPCHHLFHMEEVDEWLIQRKKLCPVCKADVTQPHPQPTEQDEASAEQHDEPDEEEGEPSEQTPLLANTRTIAVGDVNC